jgi:hypothetical protein
MNGPSCPPSPSPKRRLDTLDIELPFPRVWISPRSRRDVVQSLRHSLVLNAITSGEDLIDDAVGEPTITNVYRPLKGVYRPLKGLMVSDLRIGLWSAPPRPSTVNARTEGIS